MYQTGLRQRDPLIVEAEDLAGMVEAFGGGIVPDQKPAHRVAGIDIVDVPVNGLDGTVRQLHTEQAMVQVMVSAAEYAVNLVGKDTEPHPCIRSRISARSFMMTSMISTSCASPPASGW